LFSHIPNIGVFFFFQAEDGIRDLIVTGVQTCALPISVGATLALALSRADLDIVALDARAPGEIARGDRSLALSHGARLIFERLEIGRASCRDRVRDGGGAGCGRGYAH